MANVPEGHKDAGQAFVEESKPKPKPKKSSSESS
jgi:hypothetical protein